MKSRKYLTKAISFCKLSNSIYGFALRIISNLLVVAALFCFINFGYSQENETWKYNLPINEDFSYHYLKEDGILITKDKNDSLLIFDVYEKKIISKLKIKHLYRNSSFSSVSGYPFFWISDLIPTTEKIKNAVNELVLKNTKKKRSILVNYLTGEILVDSQIYPSKLSDTLIVKYDSESIFARGKVKGKRVFTYGEFYNPNYKWQIAEPANLKKVTLGDEINQKPIFNENYMVIGYAKNLYGISRDNGKILWSINDISYKTKLHKNKNSRNDSIFYLKNREGVRALYFKNGKDAWKSSIEFKGSKNIVRFTKNGIIVSDANQTNLYSYKDGISLLDKPIIEDRKLENIFFSGKRLLLSYENFFEFEINLLEENELVWPRNAKIRGKNINVLKVISEEYFFLTDVEMGIINKYGDVIYSRDFDLPTFSSLWHYSKEKELIYFISNNKLYELDFRNRVSRKLSILPKAKGEEEDFFNSIWIAEDNLIVTAPRHLLIYNLEGNLEEDIYYKNPGMSSKLKRNLLGVASFTAGVLLKEKLGDVYKEAYNQGYISNQDVEDDFRMTAAFGTSFGAGSITSKYTDRLIKVNRNSKESTQFNQFWIIENKEDKKYGLQICNTIDNSKSYFLPISENKNFDYEIDATLGGIFYFKDREIIFKKL